MSKEGQKSMGMAILHHTKSPVSCLPQGLLMDAQRPGKQLLFHLGSLEFDYTTFKSSWGKLLVTDM